VPIATQSFTAPYRYGVDGFTEVAEGEYICEGHELVLRFADKFRPGSTPPSRSAAWRAAGSRPRTRRTAGRASSTVAIAERAMRAISEEVGSGLEAGGVLIGERGADGSFLIHDASGPGGSLRTSGAIRHDFNHYRAVENAYAGTGLRALGVYHEHPSGSLEPSETDLEAWRLSAEMSGDQTFLGVIVGVPENPNAFRPWVRAWAVTDGVCEPVTVIS
jgi:integrative and conjugative element protein (TIGR02256 family)